MSGGGDLMCCDYCPRVWHLECVFPPIYALPRTKWRCPTCTTKMATKQTREKTENSRRAARQGSKRSRATAGSGGSSLMDMVRGDLSFEQQIALAMRQSERDEERRQRKARRTSPKIDPESAPAALSSGASSDNTMPGECFVDDFVIQEATEKIELEGFQICASSTCQ